MLPGGQDCDTQVQGRHLPRSIASGPWGEASDVGRDIGASGGLQTLSLKPLHGFLGSLPCFGHSVNW